jgi:arylsulfatase
MEADRTELNNLAVAHADRVRRMSTAWEQWAKRANVIPWIWRPQYGTQGDR